MPPPRVIELELGKPLDLRTVNGPNMELVVNEIDISDIVITLVDYDRQLAFTGKAYSANGTTSYSGASKPTETRQRIKKADMALLFSHRDVKLYYIADMSTPMNHVRLAVAGE